MTTGSDMDRATAGKSGSCVCSSGSGHECRCDSSCNKCECAGGTAKSMKEKVCQGMEQMKEKGKDMLGTNKGSCTCSSSASKECTCTENCTKCTCKAK